VELEDELGIWQRGVDLEETEELEDGTVRNTGAELALGDGGAAGTAVLKERAGDELPQGVATPFLEPGKPVELAPVDVAAEQDDAAETRKGH